MFNGSAKFCNARFLHAAADWKVRAPFLTPPTADRDRAKILAFRPVMG